MYRVKRNVLFPDWYYWYRPSYFGESQEIIHGETQTNEKGEFEIDFKAIPDSKAKPINLPLFSYEITADVTDINGETRSETTTVNVGYHTLKANVNVNDQLDSNKKDYKLTIDTQNLNGEFVPAKGTIIIYKLFAPNSVLRPRPWTAPDYQTLTKDEFKKLFPYEAYGNENDYKNWDKGKMVFEAVFNTEEDKEIALGKISSWENGHYLIELKTKELQPLLKKFRKTANKNRRN